MIAEFAKGKYYLNLVLVIVAGSLPFALLKIQDNILTNVEETANVLTLFDYPYFQLIIYNISKFICWFLFTKTTFYIPNIRIICSLVPLTILELLADLMVIVSIIPLRPYIVIMMFPLKSIMSSLVFKLQFSFKLKLHHYIALIISITSVIAGIISWYFFVFQCDRSEWCHEPYFVIAIIAACGLYSIVNLLQEKHTKKYGSPYLEIISSKGLIMATVMSILYPIVNLFSLISKFKSASIHIVSIERKSNLTYLDVIHLCTESFGDLLSVFQMGLPNTLLLAFTIVAIVASTFIYHLSINYLISKDIDFSKIQIFDNMKSVFVFLSYMAFYFLSERYIFKKYGSLDSFSLIWIKEGLIVLVAGFIPQLISILIYSEKISLCRRSNNRASLLEPYQKPKVRMYDPLIYAPKQSIIEENHSGDEIKSESYIEVDDLDSD